MLCLHFPFIIGLLCFVYLFHLLFVSYALSTFSINYLFLMLCFPFPFIIGFLCFVYLFHLLLVSVDCFLGLLFDSFHFFCVNFRSFFTRRRLLRKGDKQKEKQNDKKKDQRKMKRNNTSFDRARQSHLNGL